MKVFIFGSNGMLGKYVSKFLSDYYDIVNLTRNELDLLTVDYDSLLKKLVDIGVSTDSVVINCAGMIKQRLDVDDLDFIKVNTLFPRLLEKVCNSINCKLIHPTTDCVYTGKDGFYDEKQDFDVGDVYGMSKALGEPKNCTVIRGSIIGEEINYKKSLVEWIKSNKDSSIFGYTNHYWNGVTCLQWAKICKNIIDKKMYWNGCKHILSDTVTKFELTSMINEEYNLSINITPKETDIKCNRTLSSIYDDYKKFNIPTLKQQIKEMKEFSEKLYNDK